MQCSREDVRYGKSFLNGIEKTYMIFFTRNTLFACFIHTFYVCQQIQYFRLFSVESTSEVNSVFDSLQTRSNTISAVNSMNIAGKMNKQEGV
ncbi:MAG: hypothetical protein H6Q92_63 [Nitrospirae bacterium]|nr:hypothetical protein [Nitrospirota bacterium]